MKKLALFLILFSGKVFSQSTYWVPQVLYVASAPSGACAASPPIQIVISTGTAYTCNNGTWAAIASGGGGTGTVTSVTFTGDGVVDSATPSTAVTTSGTVLATLLTQAANTAFGNFTGSTAAPSFTATTGTGSPVAATSPTLVTPLLGTPTSGVITNLTGTCTACTANAVPAANLTGATLAAGVTASSLTSFGAAPALGTPASGVITNLTGTCTACTANATPAANLTGATLASGVTASSLTSLGGGAVGTAAFVATGTSGATIPLLNGVNTWSGAQTFNGAIANGNGASYSLQANNVATVSTCFTGGTISWIGNYWTGAASANNTMSIKPTCAVGTNGAETLTIANTAGSTGAFTVAMGNKASDITTVKALGQGAASDTGGTCAMSTSTSCTITIGHTYTTPVCIATQQSATLTGTSVGCTVSGTTVTVTAAVSNSETWGAFVFGNPN